MSASPPLQPGQSIATPVVPGRDVRRSRINRSRTASSRALKKATDTLSARRNASPKLRLVPAPPVTVRNAPRAIPLQGLADPRWVLAVRTAELLQGDILSPDRRERIIRLARMFDLTPFDANMIIAIVQDQARRGIEPHLCPAAGEPQLRMITPPRRKTILQSLQSRYGLTVFMFMGALLVIEIALIWWAI